MRQFCATDSENSDTNEEDIAESIDTLGENSGSDECCDLEKSSNEEEIEDESTLSPGSLEQHMLCKNAVSSEEEIEEDLGPPPVKKDSFFKLSESSDDEEILEELCNLEVRFLLMCGL